MNSGLSISAERRRLSRLIKVDSIIDVFRLLIDEERQMNSCIDDNDYVSAVKIATDIKVSAASTLFIPSKHWMNSTSLNTLPLLPTFSVLMPFSQP